MENFLREGKAADGGEFIDSGNRTNILAKKGRDHKGEKRGGLRGIQEQCPACPGKTDRLKDANIEGGG